MNPASVSVAVSQIVQHHFLDTPGGKNPRWELERHGETIYFSIWLEDFDIVFREIVDNDLIGARPQPYQVIARVAERAGSLRKRLLHFRSLRASFDETGDQGWPTPELPMR